MLLPLIRNRRQLLISLIATITSIRQAANRLIAVQILLLFRLRLSSFLVLFLSLADAQQMGLACKC